MNNLSVIIFKLSHSRKKTFKKISTISILIFIYFSFLGLNQTNANEYLKKPNLLELKRKEWKIIATQNEVIILNGKPPYQNLNREILIEKHKLEKRNSFFFCLVTYDSQLDKISEYCSPKEEDIEIKILENIKNT